MNPLNDPNFLRRAALCVGVVALIVGCLMSASFGLSMSTLHGFGLALLTIAGCIIFPVAGLKRAAGSNAIGLFAIGALFLSIEFFSHIGYSVGTRVMETEDTGVHNAAYQIKQQSVDRNAETLASLKADLADLKAKNVWAASVSADGLRAKLPAMGLAIEQETARGGCGPKCLKLTADKADIENRIAVAEKVDGLTAQIATVQALVNGKEQEAINAEFKSSPVVAQTKFVSQLATFELEPGQGALTWTQIAIGVFIAVATTFLAPAMLSIAFGPDAWVPGHKVRIAEATEKATDEASRLLKEVHALMARAPVAPVSAPAKAEKEVVVLEKEDPRALAILRGLESSASNLCKLRAA